jgi:hypothetical protein
MMPVDIMPIASEISALESKEKIRDFSRRLLRDKEV